MIVASEIDSFRAETDEARPVKLASTKKAAGSPALRHLKHVCVQGGSKLATFT